MDVDIRGMWEYGALHSKPPYSTPSWTRNCHCWPIQALPPNQVVQGELEELGITPTELACQIGVPPNRVSQIIAGKRSVTGHTALRFGQWLGGAARPNLADETVL